MTDRVVSASASLNEEQLDASIRPKRLDEYLGQQPVRGLEQHGKG